MIMVSTGGYSEKVGTQLAREWIDNGINCIELSGGRYSPTAQFELKTLKNKCQFHLHNYFPPPQTSFVMNLASEDEEILNNSIQHCQKAIELSAELNISYYSVHAGFLFDPPPYELGNKFSAPQIAERSDSLERFTEIINSLALKGQEVGVELLIENNVMSKFNMEHFHKNAFLMVDPNEVKMVMENTTYNVNFLLDVAHLKVSANVLKFDPARMFTLCEPWIKGYHFSDNDGFIDSNDPISKDSWFWPFIKSGLEYYSIEVYNLSMDGIKRQISLVDSMLMRGNLADSVIL